MLGTQRCFLLTWSFRCGVLVLAAATLLVLLGCQHQGLAQRQLDRRVTRLERTISVAETSERSRPAKLERTVGIIQARVDRSVQRTQRNAIDIGRCWDRTWQLWEERQPRYRRDLDRVFLGNPERIESHAITMFF
jgi:hypothetical protein